MKGGGKGKGTVKNSTEHLKPVDDRKIGKRKAAAAAKPSRASQRQTTKKGKMASKDPNKPKRPPSAFFVFLDDFRKTFKEQNPNVRSVSMVGRAGGEKWKSMSAEEKAPYEATAAKRKAEYGKLMNAYNRKESSKEDIDDSLSEVNGEDDEASAEEERQEVEEEEEEDDEDD